MQLNYFPIVLNYQLTQDMKIFFTSILLFVALSVSYSNNPIIIKKNIQWDSKTITYQPSPQRTIEILACKGAYYESAHPTLPYISQRFPFRGNGNLSVDIINEVYEPLELEAAEENSFLERGLKIFTKVEKDRKQFYGKVYFIPIRRTANGSF